MTNSSKATIIWLIVGVLILAGFFVLSLTEEWVAIGGFVTGRLWQYGNNLSHRVDFTREAGYN